jgi:hypothetical protein
MAEKVEGIVCRLVLCSCVESRYQDRRVAISVARDCPASPIIVQRLMMSAYSVLTDRMSEPVRDTSNYSET